MSDKMSKLFLSYSLIFFFIFVFLKHFLFVFCTLEISSLPLKIAKICCLLSCPSPRHAVRKYGNLWKIMRRTARIAAIR